MYTVVCFSLCFQGSQVIISIYFHNIFITIIRNPYVLAVAFPSFLPEPWQLLIYFLILCVSNTWLPFEQNYATCFFFSLLLFFSSAFLYSLKYFQGSSILHALHIHPSLNFCHTSSILTNKNQQNYHKSFLGLVLNKIVCESHKLPYRNSNYTSYFTMWHILILHELKGENLGLSFQISHLLSIIKELATQPIFPLNISCNLSKHEKEQNKESVIILLSYLVLKYRFCRKR